MLGGGEGGLPSPPANGLVVNSFIITNPTLAGERMLLIPKVSILSEQTSHLWFQVLTAPRNISLLSIICEFTKPGSVIILYCLGLLTA